MGNINKKIGSEIKSHLPHRYQSYGEIYTEVSELSGTFTSEEIQTKQDFSYYKIKKIQQKRVVYKIK